jgi:hypothetical protein
MRGSQTIRYAFSFLILPLFLTRTEHVFKTAYASISIATHKPFPQLLHYFLLHQSPYVPLLPPEYVLVSELFYLYRDKEN